MNLGSITTTSGGSGGRDAAAAVATKVKVKAKVVVVHTHTSHDHRPVTVVTDVAAVREHGRGALLLQHLLLLCY